MLIAQISDSHIARWGRKTFGIAPMAENLALCVDHINQLDPKPDLVLVTGDITNEGLLEETERAAHLLGKLHCPFYVIPGNHDDRSRLWTVFGGQACPARVDEFIAYVIDGYDVRLIGMDSTMLGAPSGEICDTRAAWLDARLSEAKEQPTIIFMHHPPVNCGVAETNLDGFAGADRLGDIVEKHSNIERLICGHIHLPAHVRWRGTVVSTAPSMGMQLVLDLTLTRASEFILEAPAYQLHHWSSDGPLVTHTVHVRTGDGQYPFEEHSGTG
ncbi:MAG: phosphodiesterase [Hyphomicrobiales bacterium]|nr:phosphodiesterase [Hyphomicrobiales bacterium]